MLQLRLRMDSSAGLTVSVCRRSRGLNADAALSYPSARFGCAERDCEAVTTMELFFVMGLSCWPKSTAKLLARATFEGSEEQPQKLCSSLKLDLLSIWKSKQNF